MPSSSIDRQHHRMKIVTVAAVVGGRGELQGHCLWFEAYCTIPKT